MTDISKFTTQQLKTEIGSASACLIDFSHQCHLELVKRSLNADSITWLAAYKGSYGIETKLTEIMDNWKVMDMVVQDTQNKSDPFSDKQQYLELAASKGAVDPLTQTAIKSAGASRVHHLHTILLKQNNKEHWILSEYLKEYNIGDRLLAVYSQDSEAESYLIVDRALGSQKFTKADEEKLNNLNTQYNRLQYWLLLERGLLSRCKKPLSLRQRQLIRLCISGYSENKMAEELGLTEKTIHTYMMDIYKLYQVNSRSSLVLLWLDVLDNK